MLSLMYDFWELYIPKIVRFFCFVLVFFLLLLSDVLVLLLFSKLQRKVREIILCVQLSLLLHVRR